MVLCNCNRKERYCRILGVEAQTLTVWRQADRYKIPRMIFINKMDRSDADLKLCCNSVESKLEKPTLCLQLPIWEEGKLRGTYQRLYFIGKSKL